MKPGVVVLYRNGESVRQATVSAVVGTGPSGYKRLDLAADGIAVSDVAHEGDAQSDELCWALYDAARITPEQEAHEETQESQDVESHGSAGWEDVN